MLVAITWQEIGRCCENVLSRELCAIPLDLFYLNGAVRHTA